MNAAFDLTRARDLLRAREAADNSLLAFLASQAAYLAEARNSATEPRLRVTLRRLAELVEQAKPTPSRAGVSPSLDNVTAEDVAIYCHVNRDLLAGVFAGTEAAELFTEVMDAVELAAAQFSAYLTEPRGVVVTEDGKIDDDYDLEDLADDLDPVTFNLTSPACVAKAGVFVENFEWLTSFGTCWVEIARRLGTTPVALERQLYRYGRGDLVAAHKPRTIR